MQNASNAPRLGTNLPNLGISMRSAGIAKTLFSGVQQRVLGLLFGQPDRSFYASELIRLVGSGTGAVVRELERLEQSGLVSARRVGNQKYYQANRASPVFDELHRLILKTVGLVGPLRDALKLHADKIKVAFVYGSVAGGTDTATSDIDLMIIGADLTYSDLFSELQQAENLLQRTINPNFLTTAEWTHKLAERSPFVAKVAAQPKMFIIGSEQDLRA